jgi:NADH:ubiquinone oxidoreductase subunit 6 (subunit J)
MCEACPTNKDRAKAVGRELLAGLLLPVITYAIVITVAVVGGAVTLLD